MKRIVRLTLACASILCICLVSEAPAQNRPDVSTLGKFPATHQRIMNKVATSRNTITDAAVSVPATVANNLRAWDFGVYPGGTWAEGGGSNNFGVMVAQGDAADGDTHLFRIDLYGPQASRWSNIGALGVNLGWFNWPLVADSGLMVGYGAAGEYIHAFVWSEKTEKTDLGALPALGLNNSEAVAVNRDGTLVAGSIWGKPAAKQYPAAWTPNVSWVSGQATVSWTIHALPTAKGFPYGFVYGSNHYGQLAGGIYNSKGVYVAALWNPMPDGSGWEIVQLPSSSDWASAIAGDINDKGEIVGDVLNLAFDKGYTSLWQPVDPQRRTYKLTLLPNPWGHPNGDTAEGINESGDIVGATWDDNGNVIAARWTTQDTSSVELLSFPGDWSFAFRVNDHGIATGTYGTYSAGPCANECVAAVQFH